MDRARRAASNRGGRDAVISMAEPARHYHGIDSHTHARDHARFALPSQNHGDQIYPLQIDLFPERITLRMAGASVAGSSDDDVLEWGADLPLGIEATRRKSILPVTLNLIRSVVSQTVEDLDSAQVSRLDFRVHPAVAQADNIAALACELGNALNAEVRLIRLKPRLRVVPEPHPAAPAPPAVIVSPPLVEYSEPPATHAPVAVPESGLVPVPPQAPVTTRLPVPPPRVLRVAEPVEGSAYSDAELEQSQRLASVPDSVDDANDQPRPGWFAVLRGLIVFALISLPFMVLPLLVVGTSRLAYWAVEVAALLIATGYVIGRIRSPAPDSFSLRGALASLGMLLARPTTAFGLLLLLIGGGIVLAPNDIGSNQAAPAKASKGRPPVVQKANIERKVTVMDGPSVAVDGLEVSGSDLTRAAQAQYVQARKPPAGYRWVIIRVEVKNNGEKVDLSRGSVRLVGASGRVHLPDIGEGVTNAPGGSLDPGGKAFWVSGFMVKAGEAVDRVELIPTVGASGVAVMRFADQHETEK